MSFSELARSLVDELGILKVYKEEGTAESMARWENVQELLSAISEFTSDREDASLESFLEEVALVSDVDEWEETRNAVTLMTLHASKGLEFPVVFIAGVEEGLLPLAMEMSDADVEEERRLMYVGMTRAQRKLYLTYARLRYRFGDPSFPIPSRFLTEIGTEGVRSVASSSVRRVAERMHGLGRNGWRQGVPRQRAVADEYFADELPPDDEERQEVQEIKAGVRVHHEVFGAGKVMHVSGKGDARKATVHFDDYGVKNLVLKFAKLRPA
jgi:DNA helicase-2/ATP-dependent DNA helicase PcrA